MCGRDGRGCGHGGRACGLGYDWGQREGPYPWWQQGAWPQVLEGEEERRERKKGKPSNFRFLFKTARCQLPEARIDYRV